MVGNTYIVELEGFNDGRPYEQARVYNLQDARATVQQLRAENKKVRYRLVQVIEDWERG